MLQGVVERWVARHLDEHGANGAGLLLRLLTDGPSQMQQIAA